jgi:UDP-glucose 4-epimerase
LKGADYGIELIHGDIRDPAVIQAAVEGVDLVFDLAAQVDHVHSNRDPLLDLDINCRGHLVVLEACRRLNPKARIIFPSSRLVYGAPEYCPVNEEHPLNCTSIYGIHKLTAERYLHFYHSAFGLNTIAVRISNTYGPRQQMKHSSYGIVNWFIRLAMDGQPLTIYGDGGQLRDYIFITEAAEAMLALALSPDTGERVYNLGSGVGTAFKEMVAVIAECIPNTEIIEVPWPADRYFVETGHYISDISRIRSAIGWEPKIDLRTGIVKTIEFYSAHREHYWDAKATDARGGKEAAIASGR